MDLSIVADGYGYLEAPRWHDGELWFSDFWARTVMSVDADGHLHRHAYVPGQPSGLGFCPDGSLLIVSTHDGHLLRLSDGLMTFVADIGATYRGGINDMVVDREGRAYISSLPGTPVGRRYGEVLETPRLPLIMVDVDGTVRVVADGLRVPNGLAISDDHSTLIVAETSGHALKAFDIAGSGSLGRERLFADLGDRTPDGICLDPDGAVWVGSPFTSEFLRVEEGGAITDIVSAPGRWAVACALGGEDGRTLYCLTARTSREDFHQGRASGAIEKCVLEAPESSASSRSKA